MQNRTDSARSLLDAAYTQLHFQEGDLLSAQTPAAELSPTQWIEKGEWLSLANDVGAEKIFFVDNNPVIVFAETQAADRDAFRQVFNNVWCMARPMLLFIARPGELAIYNLARSPVREIRDWRRTKPLDVAKSVAEVATALQKYRREQVESGKLFEDNRFGTLDRRADKSLIQDLKTVRAELRHHGLDGEKLKYAHALIGRSIFIRYLEDRGVLKNYFEKVAEGNPPWQFLLEASQVKPDLDPDREKVIYPRILADKDFAYALFDRLAQDFNGDIFPTDPNERAIVTQTHLNLLSDFLRGEAGPQRKLFFWAYKFNIIPLELISSIYEEFYHNENGNSDKKATHYTPSSLVEFLLSQVLTADILESNPRILDPACGSGIFLVEAFRRVVRFKVRKKNGERLNSKELREILRNQIAGIEINPEAVQVSAFSLLLSLLHYQEPPDILKQIEQGMHLPCLKYQAGVPTDDFHFNNLLNANTFDVELRTSHKNKCFQFMEEEDHLLFISKRFDVVVGNPPWGTTEESDVALKWCETHGHPVGDKELSQAFIWKVLDLLRDGGYAGLLVSTGVFYKHHAKSVAFRRKWLESARLKEVVNFAHARDVFFNAGVAPFASVVFEKNASENHIRPVQYWSAKKTAQAVRLQTVILNRYDLRLVQQEELKANDKLWKIYWWGNHRDRALVSWLEMATRLGELRNENGKRIIVARGFQENKNKKLHKPAAWLSDYKELPSEFFERYGPLRVDHLSPVPDEVEHRGSRDIYEGTRLLIQRGILQKHGANGRIVARVESIPFCFRNSIHGIKLKDAQEWEYKVLLAIFWSSVARYYYFLTSSTWGMWHYELHTEEIKRMPVRFPEDAALRERIISIVDHLRAWNPVSYDVFNPEGKTQNEIRRELTKLEHELDEAVFDLYDLGEEERDQIKDLCEVGLEFFYKHYKSEAVKPVDKARPKRDQGFIRNIPSSRKQQSGLEAYIAAFLQIWNYQLEKDCEFSWQVVQPDKEWPLIAIVFSASQKGSPLEEVSDSDQQQWGEILDRLGTDLPVPYHSKQIYIDGMVRALTDSDIIILKRNEKRLWTPSKAREDAEAAMVQAMNQQAVWQGA